MKIHLVKLIVSIIYVGLLLGCGNYAFSPQMNEKLAQSGLIPKFMCNHLNGGIMYEDGCNKEIDEEYINNVIEFRNICRKADGLFDNKEMNCAIYTEYASIAKQATININSFNKGKDGLSNLNSFVERKNMKKLIWAEKAKKYNTIENLCNTFNGAKYEEETRTCRFYNNDIPFEYIFIEELIREKDTQVLKRINENQRIKENQWIEEAKLFKGSLKELCESFTNSKNTFNEDTLKCFIDNPTLKQKYNIMQPLLVDQHNKIMSVVKEEEKKVKQKEEEKKVASLELFNQKWKDRVNKAKQVEQGKSYTCETNVYGNTTNSIFSLVSAPLRVGDNSIEFNGIILYLRDDYTSYYLAEGYNYSNNKIIRGKLFKGKGLKDSPYNLEISGVGFFCE